MNPQDELLETIDNYLNKGMSKEERLAFEERLALDETLTAKVNEVRLTNEAIYYASLAELKNIIGKDIKNIKYKPPFDWKKASYISIACLALVSGLTTYLVTSKSKDESDNSDQIKRIEKINQQSVEENNTSATQQKAVEAKKSDQDHSFNKQETKDSIHVENTSTQKVILPIDHTPENIVKEKAVDPENKTQTINSDLPSQKTVSSEADNKIACDKSFKITSEPSCKQKETGSIAIVSDGAYSYTFQIDTRTRSGSKALFSNIPAGIHEIMVTYGKECAYTKKVTVSEKWCAMNEAYSFNPDYNEKWIPSYEQGASGTFTIFDKSGKDIYSNTFGSGNEEWIGIDRQGMTVPVGIYVAFINYSDGRKEKVELTIVR